MNKVRWIIDEYSTDLTSAWKTEIEAQGHECIHLKDRSVFNNEMDVSEFGDDIPTVVKCSLQMAMYINRNSKAYPGVFCDLPKFKCSSYLSKLKESVLLSNGEVYYVPFGELARKKDQIIDQCGRYDYCSREYDVFIRPDVGNKIFTGQVVSESLWEKAIKNNLGSYDNLQHDDMCVVSIPRRIDEEYRMVVVDGKVVASSRYMVNHKHDEADCTFVPDEAIKLAEEAAAQYSPERCFVVDVANCTNGFNMGAYRNKFYVIEYNSFSCSGMYMCDVGAIVKTVSKVTAEEWLDVYS
jgi:hypothetical protein